MIVLNEYDTAARVVKSGDDNIAVSAGQHLKIETTPGGEEVLNFEAPAGEDWTARIIVELTKADA